jgi:hypothetical protein
MAPRANLGMRAWTAQSGRAGEGEQALAGGLGVRVLDALEDGADAPTPSPARRAFHAGPAHHSRTETSWRYRSIRLDSRSGGFV